ncbi:DUF6600 domain-containing protein [Massilia sp. MS-15]|uniref:DUF6600 domain-containing protein n=1 Tax=Massilia sp. MS-15 TaxID=2878200 RepID=UPI001CD5535E|nr:DUF6600 domain-containing protein [Massilia sp. MS-15]MCA1247653.1 thrombospondin type 3 repeat-containing protein [Massilia sp. MS-15]
MNKRFAHTAVMLALAALSTAALAQDAFDSEPPGRVGRVALAQGKVSISGGGDSATDALVNWPVTSRNLITTAPGGRTEVRVGSTAIRVDGDSSLEVTELDDDSLRLRLHYGSASIRILSDEVLPEFELSTPQGRVRMLRPGRLRVDAERVADTSVVSVFDGEARVEGGGASLTIRAGRSAELRDDDVRTLQAQRDGFDDWALERDRALDGARSARYVGTEMTGYEELDRYGSWQDDLEYGPLWIPSVATSWVPYRDGRWSWISPWGWTWVDNAPWGYAPFHYGRWVQVRNRWAWAPGRVERRPMWAPALVGWVGGSGWSVNFHQHGTRPATGWYPLGPRDHYVPHYRLSDERLRRLNSWSWREGRGRRDRDGDGRPDYRNRGLTVVPQAHFGQRGSVVVPNAPRATPSQALPATPGTAPGAPQGWRERANPRPIADRDRDGIPDRVDRDRDGDGIPNRVDSRDDARANAPVRTRDDRDGDGIRNRFDRDRDGDGIPNRVDSRDDARANAPVRTRGDRDADGIRNRFDRDREGDGIPNRVDSRDDARANAPVRTRGDRDADGIRNRFDRDRDGDGIPNVAERHDGARNNQWRERGRDERAARGERPSVVAAPVQPPVVTPPAALPTPVVTPPAQPRPEPGQPGVGFQGERGMRGDRGDRGERADRADRTERFEGRRERPQPMAPMPQPAMQVPAAPQAIAPPAPRAMPMPAPATAPSAPPPGRGRFEQRTETPDGDRRPDKMR